MQNRQAHLLAIIDDRQTALGLSDRKISLRVSGGTSVDFVRDLRRRGHAPNAAQIRALSGVIQVPEKVLMDAVSPDPPGGIIIERGINLPGSELAEAELAVCYIVGNVEAGVWRAAVELPREEWEPVGFEPRVDLAGATRFGLRVRGPSMNRFYPPGTILDCVKFIGSELRPRAGDHVIVYRRGPGDLMEATVKELVETGGHWELWPRSTHPEHQEPLRLDRAPDDDQNEDVQLVAVVVASYHRRR